MVWASNWSLVSACSILVVVILQYAGGRESCRLVGRIVTKDCAVCLLSIE